MIKQPVSDISKNVGLKMRNIIRETGNTLDSSVSLLGINNSSALSQYLNGLRGISLELLVKFCRSFNKTPNEILSFDYKSDLKINYQFIVDVIDTLAYYLKQEKLTIEESDRIKLIQYLYENNVAKDNIIPMIKIWQVANPSMFRKTG